MATIPYIPLLSPLKHLRSDYTCANTSFVHCIYVFIENSIDVILKNFTTFFHFVQLFPLFLTDTGKLFQASLKSALCFHVKISSTVPDAFQTLMTCLPTILQESILKREFLLPLNLCIIMPIWLRQINHPNERLGCRLRPIRLSSPFHWLAYISV